MSADGQRWVVLNASPDLRAQIAATPALHPRPGPLRNSPIVAVVLTGGEVDAVMGLLHLRERHAFTLHAAAPTLEVLADNPIFRVLDPDFVSRHVMPLDTPFEICGVVVTAYAVPGKVPLFAEQGHDPGTAERGEATGLALSAGDGVLHYIPGCARMTDALRQRLRGAACVMFDGTLFDDEEMIRLGAGPKTGRRMGHMPMTGPGGAVETLADLGIGRRIFVHVNNTNPALLADSPERAQLAAAGWEVAEDGLELVL